MNESNHKHFIFDAKVMHKRLWPKKNYFSYRSYYLALLMNQIDQIKDSFIFAINLISFFDRDHGDKNNTSSLKWAASIFKENHINYQKIYLITMPRVLGYVFNPISFWLAIDNENLAAVLVEVNNTFNQSHNYLCKSDPLTFIDRSSWFKAEKEFYVSPFLKREGFYHFNFDIHFGQKNSKQNLSRIFIHYYENDRLKLVTSLKGQFKPLNNKNLLLQMFKLPLLTFKVITLIHYQAVKLFFKRIKLTKRPKPIEKKLTISHKIN